MHLSASGKALRWPPLKKTQTLWTDIYSPALFIARDSCVDESLSTKSWFVVTLAAPASNASTSKLKMRVF